MIIKGQKINDRYQIIRTIGEGGMANVYLAYDTILDRNVAVKILRGDLADDEKFVRRFQREAISASSLSHPNIVEMYDVGEDDGKYFIVMEYIDGRTLKSLIKKRGALTLPEVRDIMLQLTSAIACAHESYIIHRDIKPQNVMILEDGRVKITDFGIAMALNSNELTQTNSVMGSVHYLPPEQANGSGSTIKSDIYSLGILMFELLTGKLPFKGENAVEIAIKQMKEPIPSVCKFNPNIPQSVENIILRACAKNPKNRYDSVAQMRNDIEKCLDPSVQDQNRITYLYPEHDLDETKVMPDLSSTPKKMKKEDTEDFIEKKKNKKTNLVLIITASICIVMALLFVVFALVLPRMNKVKEVKVPDVLDMTLEKATTLLKESGLEVDPNIEEKNDNTIAKDHIIKSNPKKDAVVKKGTKVKLTVSLGAKGITLEDYTGKNYYEIKGFLEGKGIVVKLEKQEVRDDDNVKEDVVLSQRPKADEVVEEGDTVTLVIPDIVPVYPDFVNESWTLDSIKQFCEQHQLKLTIEEKEDATKKEGTILSQGSRQPGDRVYEGASITIVISKLPEKDPDIEDVIPGIKDPDDVDDKAKKKEDTE